MTSSPDIEPDTIQDRFAEFATSLAYRDLPAETVHAAKVRLIDTVGVLLAGYSAHLAGS